LAACGSGFLEHAPRDNSRHVTVTQQVIRGGLTFLTSADNHFLGSSLRESARPIDMWHLATFARLQRRAIIALRRNLVNPGGEA
jgi:hypothetical protein